MANGIAHESVSAAEPDWRQQLRDAVRDIAELERLLELPTGSLMANARLSESFPLLVPRAFIERMRRGDPWDPLLRQVLPTHEEDAKSPGFVSDPLTEQPLAIHGSINKYPGRSLIITTAACPVHCRYCFRRDFPYKDQTASRDDWRPALDIVRRTPGVREVILSGGDPLSLTNDKLQRLIERIEAIPSVTTLRIHTRFPIILPARVDAGLTDLFESSRLNTVVVLHSNHPAEIDESVRIAASALKHSVGYLLNQSVLLRGINDDAETLIALGERLQTAGILPYYLHLLDPVSGAAHFDVDEATASSLIAAMRRQAPGYLVPTLVRDRAGELSKTPIA